MMLHDLIKIKYVSEGYMSDWPYHLLSDEEMFKAFLNEDDEGNDFFHDYYPLEADSYLLEYEALKSGIWSEINKFLTYKAQLVDYTIPDWVYSYMLGKVVGPRSSVTDRHDLLVSLGLDNLEDSFNRDVYRSIYDISTKYINKLRYSQNPGDVRPPTIFGEPHVLKYIRLCKVLAWEV